MIYRVGRIFQGAGLLFMPSAIWIGQFRHDERGAITAFLVSLAVFWLGWLLTRVARN